MAGPRWGRTMTDSSGPVQGGQDGQGGQGGYDPADPWAPPERVDLGKSAGQPVSPTPPSVHDQPTMMAMPSPETPSADVPPPPVAPTGPTYGYPAPPAPPAGAYGYPGYPGYGGYGQPGWPQAPANGMGTAAMVLGILALTIGWCYGVPALVLGVLALIFGILGRKRVQRGEANNGGQALAGIIMGSIGIVVGVAFIALFGYIFANIDKFEDRDSSYEDDPFQTTLVVPGRS